MATRKQTSRKRSTHPAADDRTPGPSKPKTAARQGNVPKRRCRARTSGLSGEGGLRRFFPKVLSAKPGTAEGALLALAIRTETGIEAHSVAFEDTTGAAGGRKSKRSAIICPNIHETVRLIRGLAHAERLHILGALRQGARKHVELKAVVELAAGPLYHHLRELERSGLIECPSRNNYVLTGSGRSALLIASGLNALVAKSRRATSWKAESFQKRFAPVGKPNRSGPKRRR